MKLPVSKDLRDNSLKHSKFLKKNISSINYESKLQNFVPEDVLGSHSTFKFLAKFFCNMDQGSNEGKRGLDNISKHQLDRP